MEAIKFFLIILKELMFDNALSFEDLAKLVHINPRTMRRWYDGHAPKLSSIFAIAIYFNLSVDFLLGLSNVEGFTPSSNPSTFITRYQILLEKKELNDHKVSKLIDIGSGTISKWRKGRMPDLLILIKLREVFDCNFEYLIGRCDYE